MRYDGTRLAGFSAPEKKGRRPGFDEPFFTLSMLLLMIGVVMVLSSSYARAYYDPGNVTGGNAAYYFVRQLVFALLGLGCMLLASRLPMGFYRRYAFHFLILTLVLLMLVPVIGVKANGSRRWLGVGGLTLQPSELAKLAVILSFSVMICRFRGRMRTFRKYVYAAAAFEICRYRAAQLRAAVARGFGQNTPVVFCEDPAHDLCQRRKRKVLGHTERRRVHRRGGLRPLVLRPAAEGGEISAAFPGLGVALVNKQGVGVLHCHEAYAQLTGQQTL